MLKTYIVEFWPNHEMEIKASSEEDALVEAVVKCGWLGGSEYKAGRWEFRAWVKEKLIF